MTIQNGRRISGVAMRISSSFVREIGLHIGKPIVKSGRSDLSQITPLPTLYAPLMSVCNKDWSAGSCDFFSHFSIHRPGGPRAKVNEAGLKLTFLLLCFITTHGLCSVSGGDHWTCIYSRSVACAECSADPSLSGHQGMGRKVKVLNILLTEQVT